jgi:membrane protease YdiL (CAAX protease family)
MGLLSVAVVFAILHIGWLSVLDVFFVFMIGLFFGFVVLKTKSIAGVSLSHGLTNVFLFLVMPSSINLISLVAPK